MPRFHPCLLTTQHAVRRAPPPVVVYGVPPPVYVYPYPYGYSYYGPRWYRGGSYYGPRVYRHYR